MLIENEGNSAPKSPLPASGGGLRRRAAVQAANPKSGLEPKSSPPEGESWVGGTVGCKAAVNRDSKSPPPASGGRTSAAGGRFTKGVGMLWPAAIVIAALALPAHAQLPIPAVTPPPPGAPNAPLSTLDHLRVHQFTFIGNTVFTAEQLSRVTAPYLDRDITSEDLEEARRALTLLYVRSGFINSGALLKDQAASGGRLTFTIVEGALTQIKVTGNKRYQSGFLKHELSESGAAPFNVTSIRDRLQVMRENANLRRISADVQPGARPGEAVLNVDVEENDPVHTSLQFDNHRPASIGAERLRLAVTNFNLTGRDDVLDLRAGLSQGALGHTSFSGLHDYSLGYTSPPFQAPLIGDHNTLLANYAKNDSAVIEEPFRSLDITSRFENYSLGVRHLQNRIPGAEKSLTLSLEHRRSNTFLDGEAFSFSRGDVDGQAQTTALRLSQDFVQRDLKHVFAGRGVLSWGSNFPGSTKNSAPPNGNFVIVLGQAQYVKVLGDSGRQLLLRANGQWTNRPLLSVEQFAIGGADSVRGYLENQLVRDMGVTASAELRMPVALAKSGARVLVVAPFADYGYGVNRGANGSDPAKTLTSVGLGAFYTPGNRLNAQIYYGYPLDHRNTSGHDWQDQGVEFSMVWNFG